MDLLRGAVRQYAWGSRTAIAGLMNRPAPSEQPEAELWLGAHPGDPAFLVSPTGSHSLLELLQDDPQTHLGTRVVGQFGPELPFLMKVIAADQPLSLQAHPNSAQAAEGFEREERDNLPVSAPHRNYRDARHKPEIVVALEAFDALAGFRPMPDTRRLLQAFGVRSLADAEELNAPNESDGVRALFTRWMNQPQHVVDRMISALTTGAKRYLELRGVMFAPEAKTILELAELYPGDPGVLAALLLNRITLQPGEALFLPAGNLHAYLRGVAVEVMANSDNVLRGGLTSKHVDLTELLRVLDFAPITEERLRPAIDRDGPCVVYTPPVEEFRVSVWSLGPDYVGREVTALEHEDGPHIFLCTNGSVTIRDSHRKFTLSRGEAAWISAQDRPIRLLADCSSRVFCAGVRP